MKRAKILVILIVLWLSAAPALAKRRKRTTGAPEIESSMPWLATGYAFASLAGICVVGFKNSKRTHLD